MRHSAQFWFRVGIAAFLAAVICLAPSVIVPFAVSLILAVLLTPVARCIYRGAHRAGMGRFPYDAAILLSFGIFILVIYLIIVGIIVPFAAQFKEFVYNAPAALTALEAKIPQFKLIYDYNVLPPQVRGIVTDIFREIGNYTVRIAQFSLSAAFSVAATLVELIVVPFITFYMMKKGKAFIQWFIQIFPEEYQAHLTVLFSEIHFVLNAYIRGQLTLCILMGFVVFLGMLLLGIPYPLVIGLLAAIVELVPVIGPIIGAIPPLLLALLQGYGLAAKVLIFYIIVQQCDGHFVMPKLMGSMIRVHPVAIIAGVLVGGQIFGIIGMMISVPLVAVLQVLFKHLWYYNRCREEAETEAEVINRR